MEIDLPIIVQTGVGSRDADRLYRVQPVFFDEFVEQDRRLWRATNRLVNRLSGHLSSCCRDGRHREAARFAFSPDATLHRLKLHLILRRQTVERVFPVLTFWDLDRRLAVSPFLLDVWFEVDRGDVLPPRATDIYTSYFRQLEKDDESGLAQALEPFGDKGAVWLDRLEVDVDTRQRLQSPQQQLFALLGQAAAPDGSVELERVGRCLDRLYPDDLQRFRAADAVGQLQQLLGRPECRPVMLVGPSQVGKTALVHATVHRRVRERKQSAHARRENVWLISPQRLISGMSYVGQWENRLLAILKTARKHNHVLYFDDVLGLYQAGITSQSNLAVADVLKPYVQRGEIRVLAEMTAEQLRVLRERDRGFADLFQVLPVDEPDERELLTILLEEMRELELHEQCLFETDVLPAVSELTRRYQPDVGYPGKAVTLLQKLAQRHPEAVIDRDALMTEFRMRSGLDRRLLDRRTKLSRGEVQRALEAQILGQPEALDAMTDVVMTAKAALSDPQRPLGSLLFIGPTGVGKTESAKALARFLFSDEGHLMRFDMNEFVSPVSVARLMGTFDQPEGLLTSAVREQPFGVLLFDEIEKAHANVFDLLLQLLGEARLTDALGRTVNFSNVVVILTSNLGTREASTEVGFAGQQHSQREVYLRAVREFFRPEFFNRIDRIVPFDRLEQTELSRMARRLVRDVLAREGFSRRQCALDLGGETLQWVTERGYHAKLGARAMKRAVEDHIVHPVSHQLAEIPKQLPTIVSMQRRGERLEIQSHALREAELASGARRPVVDRPSTAILGRAEAAADRLWQACLAHRPPGELGADRLEANTLWYVGISEFCRSLRARIARMREAVAAGESIVDTPVIAPKQARGRIPFLRNWSVKHSRNYLKEMVAAQEIHDYLADVSQEAEQWGRVSEITWRMQNLVDTLAMIDAVQPSAQGWPTERALVVVRGLAGSERERERLVCELCRGFPISAGAGEDPATSHPHEDALGEFGLHASRWPDAVAERTATGAGAAGREPPWWDAVGHAPLVRRYRDQLHLDVVAFEGHRTCRLLASVAGTYLFTDPEGRLKPVQLVVLPIAETSDEVATLLDCLGRHDAAGAAAQQSPFRWREVVAVYACRGGRDSAYGRVLDFRAGLTATRDESIPMRAAWQATLALPPELQEVL